MIITVNGNTVEFTGSTLQEYLAIMGYGERIVVELNGKIIKKEVWKSVLLSPNDVLEVVAFVGGG